MAIIESIQLGVVTTLERNVVKALPPVIVHGTASAAIEIGNDSTSTTAWVLLSASTTGSFLSSAFVRCTTATTNICVKKF